MKEIYIVIEIGYSQDGIDGNFTKEWATPVKAFLNEAEAIKYIDSYCGYGDYEVEKCQLMTCGDIE